MGTWGVGIYSNDIAEDVREACKDIYAIYDVDEGNELLFNHFSDILNQKFVDNEYASFWYALADWQWKHGMLNDEVKEKTLLLLKDYSGIDEWQENCNRSELTKRKKVLDLLRKQLLMQQQNLKRPKFLCSKPKHHVGEIVIFQASATDNSIWKIESLKAPFMYKSSKIANSKYEDVIGYNAQGKYMAILCIGTEKELHSEYIPNAYDERSVYVWYDYLSDAEPTIKDLEQCGFLPFIDIQWEDFNRNIVNSAKWMYKFTLSTERFISKYEYQNLKKVESLTEVARYNNLFSKKRYSDDIWGGFDLISMFDVVFEEKHRVEIIGDIIDNLLSLDVINPEMRSSGELKKAFRRFFKE